MELLKLRIYIILSADENMDLKLQGLGAEISRKLSESVDIIKEAL